MPSVLQMALGLEGLALLRGWLIADEAAIAQRIDEIRSLADEGAAAPAPFLAPEYGIETGYAVWASTYDEPGNPFVDIEQPVVSGLLDGLPRGRALDAACGTGRHAAYLRSLGHEVVAIDATAEMLEKLQGRAPDVEIRQGDLRALPVDTATVDAAVCSLALTHCVDLGQPISELSRVVRPGGQIIISDIHPFAVFLGVQAFFAAAGGTRGFVRNYVHLPSAYLTSFRASRLEVLESFEPTLGVEHAADHLGMTLRAFPAQRESLASSIDGLPAVMVWHLARL